MVAVTTVLGPVESDTLGMTLMHEAREKLLPLQRPLPPVELLSAS